MNYHYKHNAQININCGIEFTCTAHLDPCLWSNFSFPLLMQAASEDNNNLAVPPFNKLVPGFVLYGGYLSKIH